MSQAKRVVLASRPVGEPKPSNFRIEEYAPPVPGQGQVLLRIHLAVARSLYARADERRAVLCDTGADRRRHGRRHGGRGGRLERSRLRQGRHRAVALRLADACAVGRQGTDAKSIRGSAPVSTALGVLGMPGMTAYTGLSDIGQPQAGRDRGGRGGIRRGRLGGRADRQDQGRARGRHRRRRGEMRLRQTRTRLRRLPRSPRRPILRRS